MGKKLARRQRHVIIFARSPEYGRVKTRLAREVGTLAAWRFYRNTTEQLLSRLDRDPTWQVWLAWTGNKRRGWTGKFRTIKQGRGGLGQRMEHCLRAMPPGDVVLLGSDIPGVTRGHIRRAFDGLKAAPLVFGPAVDGGFWLVGSRRVPGLPRPLFPQAVRWSTETTLADVLSGLRVPSNMVDRLQDVDTAADIAAFKKSDAV